MVEHFFTVDVEEYFHVSAFDAIVPRSHWDRLPSRADASVDKLLQLLSDAGARGTFFVLGWLARRRPALVRRIRAAGHEIASHGWAHQRVTSLTPAAFRADVRDAKHELEDITGHPVRGYRAPSFSITRAHDWALDVLLQEGYRYDSSLMPVRRPGYGFAGGARDVHWIRRTDGRLLEFPPATLEMMGARVPAGGGAYLRLFPLSILRAAFRDSEQRGVSATLYVHPWELDPDQPRFDVPWWTGIRHYGRLSSTEGRLASLLRDFRFRPIASCAELQ